MAQLRYPDSPLWALKAVTSDTRFESCCPLRRGWGDREQHQIPQPLILLWPTQVCAPREGLLGDSGRRECRTFKPVPLSALPSVPPESWGGHPLCFRSLGGHLSSSPNDPLQNTSFRYLGKCDGNMNINNSHGFPVNIHHHDLEGLF